MKGLDSNLIQRLARPQTKAFVEDARENTF